MQSRTVDWWSVHLYVEPTLDEVGSWPMVGSLLWQHLPTDDPAKLAAIFDAAQHWALRVDTCQAQLAEASRDIAAAADWPKIARNAIQRQGIYIPREVA
ncbi:MAG: hypothetical protein QG671_3703 [Actinomycetota bacterium]|jgi:hypothetical protein|nr:hypothetical protein [Actinomycetota bacterium]